MKFELLASQVMRRHVHTVSSAVTLSELEHLFVQSGVSGFAVVQGEQVVGVVSRTDLVKREDLERETAERTSDFFADANDEFHEIPIRSGRQVADRVGEQMSALTVADVMSRHVVAVGPDQSLRMIADTMVDQKIHRVLVTTEGRLLGVVSTSDFVRLYSQGRIMPADH